jgi:hypothetical protein
MIKSESKSAAGHDNLGEKRDALASAMLRRYERATTLLTSNGPKEE